MKYTIMFILLCVSCGSNKSEYHDIGIDAMADVFIEDINTELFPQVGDTVAIGTIDGSLILFPCCPVIDRDNKKFHLGPPCKVYIVEDGTFLVGSCITGRKEVR